MNNNDQTQFSVKPIFQDVPPAPPPMPEPQNTSPLPSHLINLPNPPGAPPSSDSYNSRKGWVGNKKIIATLLGLIVVVSGIGACLLLVSRQQEIRKEAAPAGSQEELFGETWTKTQCESAGGVILDFEADAALASKKAAVDTWNKDPYNISIYSSVANPKEVGPYLAAKGSPRESFEGPSTQSCPATDWNSAYRDDLPKQADAAITGNYWLTDDGAMGI